MQGRRQHRPKGKKTVEVPQPYKYSTIGYMKVTLTPKIVIQKSPSYHDVKTQIKVPQLKYNTPQLKIRIPQLHTREPEYETTKFPFEDFKEIEKIIETEKSEESKEAEKKHKRLGKP